MSVSFSGDIRPQTDLTSDPLALVRPVQKTGRPIVVATSEKPNVVLMDADTFERRLKVANLSQLLAAGEEDVRSGRTRPAAEFFRELGRGKKVRD